MRGSGLLTRFAASGSSPGRPTTINPAVQAGQHRSKQVVPHKSQAPQQNHRRRRPFKAATALCVAGCLRHAPFQFADPVAIVDALEYIDERFPDLTLHDFIGALVLVCADDPDCREFQHGYEAPPRGNA